MSTIRVVVADDHPVVREGIALLLGQAPDIDVVAQAGCGKESVALTREHQPDVLLLDFEMPDMDALGVMRRLKADGCTTRVLILTNHEQTSYASQCLSQGALGFVAKSAGYQEVLDALHAVHAGQRFLSPSLAPGMAANAGGEPKGVESLSAREFELLRLMGLGLSLQEASHKMHVTESTVSTYRQRLMKKLNLRNTAEIIRYAVEHGLVDGSQPLPPQPPEAPQPGPPSPQQPPSSSPQGTPSSSPQGTPRAASRRPRAPGAGDGPERSDDGSGHEPPSNGAHL